MFASALRLFAVALLLVALPGAAADPEQAPIEMTLRLGEQRVLSSEGVKSYSEGVRGIVDVRLTRDATQFIIIGVQAGTTSLLFILLDGTERHYAITVDDGRRNEPETEERATIEARDNIRLDFYFVQLNKSYNHQIGVGWPGTVGGGQLSASYDVLEGSFDSATAVVADQALPRVDMAQSAGWAKILRQAAVITANGTEASFSGGGEINIPIQGSLAAEIRSIQFGSTVKVLPRFDPDTNRIELRLEAQVSDLVDDNGTGAPGRVTSDLSTVVNLELGQTLVLAGLTARSKTRGKTGLPVLSQIPILGALFGSNVHREQEAENVILIVPTVVDAVSVQARDRIKEALRVYEEYDGDLESVELMPPVVRKRRTAGGSR